MSLYIRPWVNQLWPPEGDNGVTNMDVVFFSDLEDERIAPPRRKPGETWVQKGHPEVCWPEQWLPEDLGSNVRIFEIRFWYHIGLTGLFHRSVEEVAIEKLDDFAKWSLDMLQRKISIEDEDGQGCPLVFVGHGYGGWMLKQALVKLHDQSGLYKDIQSKLCGIMFYGVTNTKLTRLKDWLLEHRLLQLSECFEAALDLKKVKVCVVNKNKSILQEIIDYSDLERHFFDVMDSNDICTPTSKEDPSYYTLLEFLRQFLPKGLHQTIDDKKGQKIQLRWSETKDKEALGDMEIASTSTREDRDKEMYHVVCNVDQDRDMLTEEAHELQTFLCRKIEMAQRHESSTIFPNLHELHSKFLKDASIFAGVRENVEMDSIEFLFLDAECMSKVVGVGLHQALITVTNDNDVKVEALSESDWESLLAFMFMEVQDSRSVELIGLKMPMMEEDKIETMSLPSKDVAKQFGMGLKDLHGDHIITMNKGEENKMFFLVIWKVAEVYKALKEGDPHVTKRPSGVGSSTSASGDPSGGSNQQGKEEGKSVQGRSPLKSSNSQKEGKNDEKDDERKPPGGDPPPNFEPSSEPKMGLHKYTVKVYPKAGHGFEDASRIPFTIKQQLTTASISPTILTIVFSRNKEKEKFLNVTAQTQCNLGHDAQCNLDHDAHLQSYFGWFQDDITISFNGISAECQGTRLETFTATNQKGEEGTTTKETINITLGEDRGLAIQKSWGMKLQSMFGAFGMGGDVGESSTKNVVRNFSKADIEEIISVKQIEGFNVHESNVEHNLIYQFRIPTSINNSTNVALPSPL